MLTYEATRIKLPESQSIIGTVLHECSASGAINAHDITLETYKYNTIGESFSFPQHQAVMWRRD